MWKDIKEYIRKCEICQLCKYDNKVLCGEIPGSAQKPRKSLENDSW